MIEIDVATGSIIATLPNVIDAYGGIYFDSVDNTLYVGERDATEMGIRVFKNNVQVGSAIKSSNSLPPTSITIAR